MYGHTSKAEFPEQCKDMGVSHKVLHTICHVQGLLFAQEIMQTSPLTLISPVPEVISDIIYHLIIG